MSKKNTIIVAVLINAALLTLLFITASSHEDEYYAKSHIPAPQREEKPIEVIIPEQKPVELSSSLAQNSTPASPAPVEIVQAPQTTPSQEQVIHILPEAALENKPVPIAAAPAIAIPKLREVVVKKGDSLDKIARTHKVSLEEIVKLNHLPNSFLRIGQVLKIPESSAKAASPKPAQEAVSSQLYIVKAGDNPWTIAMKHHMKVEELLKLNHLDKEKAKRLKPGDKLRVR